MSHAFSYTDGVLSYLFDFLLGWTPRITPRFVLRLIEKFLRLCLDALIIVGAVKFSKDPEKAATLRSRVIWDEAKKRGKDMEQLIIFGKYTDNYRARINGKFFYFNSLPLDVDPAGNSDRWDDKFFLKKRLREISAPVPRCENVPFLKANRRRLFEKLTKPLVVKPRSGSRGRHTTTNINTFEEFEKAVKVARKLSPHTVAEEYLSGYVCRATCVDGRLAGFYRANEPYVTGDGEKTLRELIQSKNDKRPERVKEILVSDEILQFVGRLGLTLDGIPQKGRRISLTHRTGRYFGGGTREMLDELHKDFIPILESAARLTGLPVVGLDCIVPDPEHAPSAQRWGIIECNTLPFIDLHYFALEGKPRNIAGMVWDMVEKK